MKHPLSEVPLIHQPSSVKQCQLGRFTEIGIGSLLLNITLGDYSYCERYCDLANAEIKNIVDKYNEIINNSSGKVLKIEEWGLINLSNKIKNYKKGFYIPYKFEGNANTLSEIKKKIKIDTSIIRFLTVKYKKIDLEQEFFKKDSSYEKKK